MHVEPALYLSVTAEIKRAYKKKAKEHHPDKNPNDPEASSKFQEMAAAYEILNDPQMRTVYDKEGMSGLSKGGGGGAGMDAADIFAQFFGASGMYGFEFDMGSGRRRHQQSREDVIPISVTLEDLYNGKTVKMNLERSALCGGCKGTGGKKGAKPKQCAKCEGKGWILAQSQISPSRFGTSRARCHDCDGNGEKLREKDRCKKCGGEKVVQEKKRHDLIVEKGMADGQRIILPGVGDEQPGLGAEDVVFVLKQTSHASFERSGSDLLTNVKITLSEALLGFSRILVTHLDGRGLKVTSPPRKIIKNNESIVIRGEGMPIHKDPGQTGDLYVVLDIELPDEDWLETADLKALESILPPRRMDVEPLPAVVEEADYEESNMDEFGEDEDDDEGEWMDEDDDEDDPHGFHAGIGEPECRPQ